MFFSGRPGGDPYEVPTELQPALSGWIILQVRQLQRLALESLLSWCEARVIGGVTDTADLTRELEKLFRTQSSGVDPDDTLAAILQKFDERIPPVETFVSLGRSDALFSPFALMDDIQAAFKAKEERYAAVSLYGLLLCVSFAGCFSGNDQQAVKGGGASRSSAA